MTTKLHMPNYSSPNQRIGQPRKQVNFKALAGQGS